jgi:hypothetical protein
MDEYIKREAAVAIIEEKQKELCPLGRYSRTMVYGSDRDRFDSWQEIINSIEDIPAADVVEVRHGKWIWDENGMDWGLGAWTCSECHLKPETWWEADKGNPYRCAGSSWCNNCGARMDGGVNDAAD